MEIEQALIGLASALLVVFLGVMAATPLVFAGRVMPLAWVDGLYVGGVSEAQLPGVLQAHAAARQAQVITLTLRGKEAQRSLGEMGVSLDVEQSVAQRAAWWQLDEQVLHDQVNRDFADVLRLPVNASLRLQPGGQLAGLASAAGEGVDWQQLTGQLRACLQGCAPVALVVVATPPAVTEAEVEGARQLGGGLAREGFGLRAGDQEFTVKPSTIERLLQFIEEEDPAQPGNKILGVRFEPAALRSYLEATIGPEINQAAADARFELKEGRVTEFMAPQAGQALDLDGSVAAINEALGRRAAQAELAVVVTEPTVGSLAKMNELGITERLAAGESDFRGSPRNRIHNITVGTARYHGLLIPPDEEFSFNNFLGPVDRAHGFLPELVIKHNVTTPEFGGGLCQVSTTAFRAAVASGLKVTARRNHAYAVRYYGTPGFDATIYPPYTDLRFLNNTPGYILVQTKIEGTKLTFEFWGTSDGRQVEIEGPSPYARQSNGAVKATLKQKVTRGDGVLLEDTFYSNYKSPALFPHALREQPAAATAAAPTPAPTPAPKPKASPQPSPKASAGEPPPTPESESSE